MTPDKFSELLGQIDDQYLAETNALREKALARKSAQRKYMTRGLAAAAALSLVVGLAAFQGIGPLGSGTKSAAPAEAAGVSDEAFSRQESVSKDTALPEIAPAAAEEAADEDVMETAQDTGAPGLLTLVVRIDQLEDFGFTGAREDGTVEIAADAVLQIYWEDTADLKEGDLVSITFDSFEETGNDTPAVMIRPKTLEPDTN